MIRFQKKPVLMLAKDPTFIRRESNGKHNEVTVVMVQYTIPLNNILSHGMSAFSPNLLRVMFQASKGFQGIDFRIDSTLTAPTITFTTKAKTERRGDDVPDQNLADKIVMAKANAKACTIARRILGAVNAYYLKEVDSIAKICEVLRDTGKRELSYIQKV